jgi:hypothetical protein
VTVGQDRMLRSIPGLPLMGKDHRRLVSPSLHHDWWSEPQAMTKIGEFEFMSGSRGWSP